MNLLYISTADWLGIIAIAVTIIGGVAYLIFRTGSVFRTVEAMAVNVDKIPGIEVKMASMDVKVEELWRQKITQSQSPMVLNVTGQKILEDSKISELTDIYYSEILEKVRLLKPQNPFQAQEFTIAVVSDYRNKDDCRPKLKSAAFNSGYDVSTILFVAAINVRDKVITDLGFSMDDIDKHDPKNRATHNN